jgi:hypothetical protein
MPRPLMGLATRTCLLSRCMKDDHINRFAKKKENPDSGLHERLADSLELPKFYAI